MKKKKKYFLVLYDEIEQKNTKDFNSIKECAEYFNTTYKTICDWIKRKNLRDKKYRIYKYNDIF